MKSHFFEAYICIGRSKYTWVRGTGTVIHVTLNRIYYVILGFSHAEKTHSNTYKENRKSYVMFSIHFYTKFIFKSSE